MSVSLVKIVPVAEGHLDSIYRTRQWAATVDLRVQVGPWVYQDLADGKLSSLREAFAIKVHDAIPGPRWSDGFVADDH